MYKNIEIRREKARAYARKNRAKNMERAQRWKLNNYEKSLLISAKHNAIKMGREFNIDLSDIKIPETCPLLGTPITKLLGAGRRIGTNPSLDRIDSSKGYIKGNVQVISDKANRIKMDLSREELLILAHNIIKLYE